MANKISISFKNTSKEIVLYEYLNSLEDRSGEIKKLLMAGITALNIDIFVDSLPSETFKHEKTGDGQDLLLDVTNF